MRLNKLVHVHDGDGELGHNGRDDMTSCIQMLSERWRINGMLYKDERDQKPYIDPVMHENSRSWRNVKILPFLFRRQLRAGGRVTGPS